MPASNYIIGIDGGGSATAAILADARTGATLGRGEAGPSNFQAVGVTAALRELNTAVAGRISNREITAIAGRGGGTGLAGVDRNEGLDVIRGWADLVHLADKFTIANDATLLFAAGTPDGWGLAVIAGTGSIAFTLDQQGKDSRTGGWGYMLGDEGSAFRIGLLALRTACRAADGIGEPTSLLTSFLEKLGSADARDFIPAVYRGSWDKAFIAGFAPTVLNAAANGDHVATHIFEDEARELAKTAAGAVAAGGLPRNDLPVALTGGLVIQNEVYRDRFLNELCACGVTPGPVGLVDDPVVGAVVLARKLFGAKPA